MPRIPSAWNLWENPIFIRYCRSRLRTQVLLPIMVVLVVCVAFIYLVPYFYLSTHDATEAQAARLALLPLFALQAALLMLSGTGSVASGLSQENDDGMIDYQRLTPMPPSVKILGYLFGLPVREYVLFIITLPFVVYGAHVAELPWWPLVRFYTIFLSSAVLYHLVGLVAGTVFKTKAVGRMVQVMVLLLYLVFPRLAHVGFDAFSYFTVLPEFAKDLAPALLNADPDLRRVSVFLQQREPIFFGVSFSVTVFSLLIQAGLLVGFWMVLWRKWRRAEHHLLGKPFAILGMAWLASLLLGSSLPLIPSGRIFPFREQLATIQDLQEQRRLEREEQEARRAADNPGRGRTNRPPRMPRGVAWLRDQVENYSLQGGITAAVFGLLAFGGAVGFASVITPNRDEYRNGLLRAAKHRRRWPPPWTDHASATLWTLAIGAIAAGSWIYFCRELFGSHHFESTALFSPREEWKMAAAIGLPLMLFQLMLESWGKGRAFLAVFFLWLVPLLLALLLLALKMRESTLEPLAVSAVALPFFLMTENTGLHESRATLQDIPAITDRTLLIYAVGVALLLIYRLRFVWKLWSRIRIPHKSSAVAADPPSA